MTLADWQSSPKLIGAWRDLMASDLMRNALSVLDNISPAEIYVRINESRATENACVLLGQIQGYKWMLQNMRMMTQAAGEPPKQPIPTYGAKPDSGEKPVTKK